MGGEQTVTRREKGLSFLVLAAAALAMVALCSMSSPLYPINIWGDANCLMTVGRAMKAGAVVYRDIYEQKGPTLYLAHMLAACISDSSFFGVYLMEAACMTIFLWTAFRMMRRRLHLSALPAAAVTGACILMSATLVRGDSAEEFCLPFLLGALALADVSYKEGKPMAARRLFLCGLLAGVVATVKFTLLGVFIGLCAAEGLLALRQGGVRRALVSAGVFLGGMALPVLLWGCYFAANGALGDAYTAYIHNNIFLYAGEGRYTFADWIAFLKGSGWWALPALLGTLAFLLDRREAPAVRLAVLLSAAVQFAAVVMPGRVWQYSLMALAPYTVFGALEFGKLLERIVPALAGPGAEGKRTGGIARLLRCGWPTAAAAALCFVLCWFGSPNGFLRGTTLGGTVQGRLKELIEPGASFLQYKFLDDGMYLTTGALPQEKYFVLLNVDLQEMHDELDRYVEEGRPDYVLSIFSRLPKRFDKYELIGIDIGYLDNNKPQKEFYLYRRKDK